MKTRREKCVHILLCIAMISVKCVYLLCLTMISLTWPVYVFGESNNGAAQSPVATVQSQSQSQARPGITGEWQGALSRLRLILKIEQPENAPLKGVLISVDQGNASIPIDTVSFDQDGTLRLDMKSLTASYEGKLSADGAQISGTWRQGGNSLPLLFHRPGASAAAFTLKPRTQGRIALEPCHTLDGNLEALCGKYEVYENRQSQKGRKIALKIMVLPATSDKPAPDPFFALAGGPGQSATESFPFASFVGKVRQQRDVVLVDQRGTGGSNPLQCDIRGDQDAQSMVGEYFSLEKVRQCRIELEKKADLAEYTTSIAADDLDEVRQAMGYEKINVFGGSYGTKAALVYLRQHGDHVRTMALEGVATPQYRMPLPFAKTIQSSVDRLIDRCAADAACRKDFPNLRVEFNSLLAQLEKSPAHFELQNQPVTLARGVFVAHLRRPLYVPAVASQFPLMIHSAYQGDWTRYASAVLALNKAFDQGLARGASFAAICSEDMPGLTENTIRRETAGTYLGDFQVRLYQKACEGWPHSDIPKQFYAPIHSNVPALLISGVLDPATPPEMAQQVAHDLTNGRLIPIKEGTHGTGDPCIDGLISDFVRQGSAAGLDASCADQIHLPPFFTQTQPDQLRQKAGSSTER